MESLVMQHAGFDIPPPPPHYWRTPPVIVSSTSVVVFGLMSDMLSLATSSPTHLLYMYSMHSCHTADRCGPTDRYTLWFGHMWENIRHSDRRQYNMSDQWLFYSSPPYNNRQWGKRCLNTRWQNRARVHWSNSHDELYLLVMHYEWTRW